MQKLIFALVALLLLISAPMYGQPDMRLVINDFAGHIAIFDVNGTAVTPDLTGCAGCALGFLPPAAAHGQLIVTGTIGQFNITITGQGHGIVTSPTLQNLNEIDATTSGAGNLGVTWTDTDYTNFGESFAVAVSGVYSAPIAAGSSSSFFYFMDPGNTVPAGVPIGSLVGLTCGGTPCAVAATDTFANPDGSSGSLTTAKIIHFSGAGEIQLNSSIAIPEPAGVLLLSSLLGTGLMLRRRFATR
jgi:hypothetical protein